MCLMNLYQCWTCRNSRARNIFFEKTKQKNNNLWLPPLWRVGNEKKIADIDISPGVRTRGYEHLSKFIWMTKRYSICQGLHISCSPDPTTNSETRKILNQSDYFFDTRIAKLVLNTSVKKILKIRICRGCLINK